MRVTPGLPIKLKLLDTTINEKLIPAIVGRKISPEDRKLISLPAKFGGMAIPILSELAIYRSSTIQED